MHPSIRPRVDLLRTLGSSLRSLLFRASPEKNALHDVKISFVTCELIELVLGWCQTNGRRPWFRPCRRVVDGKLVGDRVGGDTREPFDQMQVFGGAHEVA